MLPGSGAGPAAGEHGGNREWKRRASQPGWKARRFGEVPGRKSAPKRGPLGVQISSVIDGEIDLLFEDFASSQ